MDQLDLLRLVAQQLEQLGIEYAVVGSYASGAWGEPRMTQDIDIVVDLNVQSVEGICAAFGSDEFYVSPTAATEAVAAKSQFNLIHPASGNKVDFMISDGSDWARSELTRSRREALLDDLEISVATPEDVILGKLLYYRDGGSDKHLRDITGILTTKVTEIDQSYIESWAEKLGVGEEWRAVVDRLGE